MDSAKLGVRVVKAAKSNVGHAQQISAIQKMECIVLVPNNALVVGVKDTAL